MKILTRSTPVVPTSVTNATKAVTWRQELKESIRTIGDLLDFVGVSRNCLHDYQPIRDEFPIRVTRSFASRIERGNSTDPLLLQLLAPATKDETDLTTSDQPDPEVSALNTSSSELTWSTDPVSDSRFQPVSGLLHKYQGRVLIVTTGACAIHCRYCFRQHFDYSESIPSNIEPILEYIASDDSIDEVIFSGGDPFMLVDSVLKRWLDRLQEIPHVQNLRFHTRLPIVLPSRFDADLISMLSTTRFQCRIVIHANHAQEFDASVEMALKKIDFAGIHLLNQSVLLKGINDSAEALVSLSKILLKNRVIPYYLHLLDPVVGAENFDVSENAALEIHRQVQSMLPGYAVPKLVREVPGNPNKTLIA